MITKNLFGMLTIMAFLMFGCGDATQRGGDDNTDTINESEEVTANDVSMEEPEANTSESETDGETAATWHEDMAEEEPSTSEARTQPESNPKTTSTPATSKQRLAYRAGTTTQVSGSIQGTNTQEYISTLPAESLTFKLITDNPAASLMVTDTGGKRLSPAGNEVTYTIPTAGDYLIKVFMNMANDASSQKADYRLQIRAAD